MWVKGVWVWAWACRSRKRVNRAATRIRAAIIWRGEMDSPRTRADRAIPKKGAVAKIIWLRVAPRFWAAVM